MQFVQLAPAATLLLLHMHICERCCSTKLAHAL